eukprot:269267-Chlamydomonas_euryale.AAC.2
MGTWQSCVQRTVYLMLQGGGGRVQGALVQSMFGTMYWGEDAGSVGVVHVGSNVSELAGSVGVVHVGSNVLEGSCENVGHARSDEQGNGVEKGSMDR